MAKMGEHNSRAPGLQARTSTSKLDLIECTLLSLYPLLSLLLFYVALRKSEQGMGYLEENAADESLFCHIQELMSSANLRLFPTYFVREQSSTRVGPVDH
jgi:hypothetical protein